MKVVAAVADELQERDMDGWRYPAAQYECHGLGALIRL